MQDIFNFGPAAVDEDGVFGARAPYPGAGDDRKAWLEVITAAGIAGVLCLMEPSELRRYGDSSGGLPGFYTQVFPLGVRLLPIDPEAPIPLRKAKAGVEWLAAGEREGRRLLVHCSQGLVRTSIVLAAWRVWRRGVDPAAAIAEVAAVPGVERDPRWPERNGYMPPGGIARLLRKLQLR